MFIIQYLPAEVLVTAEVGEIISILFVTRTSVLFVVRKDKINE
jgi:hypothetical protein